MITINTKQSSKINCTRPRAQFFSHTDRPSPVNNIFYFFPAVNWFYRVLKHGFVCETIVIESACAPSTDDL